jgi:hypothetical protein
VRLLEFVAAKAHTSRDSITLTCRSLSAPINTDATLTTHMASQNIAPAQQNTTSTLADMLSHPHDSKEIPAKEVDVGIDEVICVPDASLDQLGLGKRELFIASFR